MSELTEFEQGEVILHCRSIEESLEFYTEKLSFRLESIFPADNPTVAVISGYGLQLRLISDSGEVQVTGSRLRIPGSSTDRLVSPDGVEIEIFESLTATVIPEPDLDKSIIGTPDASAWVTGRAGMRYRDLIPGRLGGFLIASHIHVQDAGPIADYVHYHKIRFQLIFCLKGRAKLVYEDHGDPFQFGAGDCVLQPPEIRHRVLESSGDFDVVEVSCPAEHETHAEYDFDLPNGKIDRDRKFGGQRFAWSRSSHADWKQNRGYEVRQTEIAEASGGIVGVRVFRSTASSGVIPVQVGKELKFFYVIDGRVTMIRGDEQAGLQAGASVLLASGTDCELTKYSEKFNMLEVTVPLG
jgi:mannose-6-phosphate isomerase-like protein (cupin superfamily)